MGGKRYGVSVVVTGRSKCGSRRWNAPFRAVDDRDGAGHRSSRRARGL